MLTNTFSEMLPGTGFPSGDLTGAGLPGLHVHNTSKLQLSSSKVAVTTLPSAFTADVGSNGTARSVR